MPKILVAPDKFRETLTAPEAADAIARGLRAAGAFVEVCPVADGGEGTLDTLAAALGGSVMGVVARGPLGVPVRAHLGIAPGAVGIVELAQASGLALVDPAKRDPLRASTHGTGECIKAALARSARRILIGLGGSATIDAGLGLARALGVGFYDRDGKPVGDGIEGLEETVLVDLAGLDRRLGATELLVAADVTHRLLGCVRTFGPQKGANPTEIERAERAFERFAGVFAEQTSFDLRDVPGGGSAGGAAAMLAALGARVARGAEVVLEAIAFGDRLTGVDLVVTGEGALDETSFEGGKATIAVAAAAESAGVPCVAFVGRDDLGRLGPFLEVRSLVEHFRGDVREARSRAGAGLQALSARFYSDRYH